MASWPRSRAKVTQRAGSPAPSGKLHKRPTRLGRCDTWKGENTCSDAYLKPTFVNPNIWFMSLPVEGTQWFPRKFPSPQEDSQVVKKRILFFNEWKQTRKHEVRKSITFDTNIHTRRYRHHKQRNSRKTCEKPNIQYSSSLNQLQR